MQSRLFGPCSSIPTIPERRSLCPSSSLPNVSAKISCKSVVLTVRLLVWLVYTIAALLFTLPGLVFSGFTVLPLPFFPIKGINRWVGFLIIILSNPCSALVMVSGVRSSHAIEALTTCPLSDYVNMTKRCPRSSNGPSLSLLGCQYLYWIYVCPRKRSPLFTDKRFSHLTQ